MLHARAPRYGTRRLRQALQARALPAELVEDALQRTQASEEARACAVWRRRFGARRRMPANSTGSCASCSAAASTPNWRGA